MTDETLYQFFCRFSVPWGARRGEGIATSPVFPRAMRRLQGFGAVQAVIDHPADIDALGSTSAGILALFSCERNGKGV